MKNKKLSESEVHYINNMFDILTDSEKRRLVDWCEVSIDYINMFNAPAILTNTEIEYFVNTVKKVMGATGIIIPIYPRNHKKDYFYSFGNYTNTIECDFDCIIIDEYEYITIDTSFIHECWRAEHGEWCNPNNETLIGCICCQLAKIKHSAGTKQHTDMTAEYIAMCGCNDTPSVRNEWIADSVWSNGTETIQMNTRCYVDEESKKQCMLSSFEYNGKQYEYIRLSNALKKLEKMGFVYKSGENGIPRAVDMIFVYVRFEYGFKDYCYLADEDIYNKGDLVRVPTKSDAKIEVAKVTRVERHFAEDAPYPLEKLKKVIGKTEAVCD